LILRKIIEIIATRSHILKLKCTKFDFGLGFAPDQTERTYIAPTDTLAGFKGPTSKGKGKGKDEKKGRGRGRGEGRVGEWRGKIEEGKGG